MQVPAKALTRLVKRLEGLPSRQLAEHCPDGRVRFPAAACPNVSCEWGIKEPEYHNCTWVAANCGGHSHARIGAMLGVTPQAVQKAELAALRKLRLVPSISTLIRIKDIADVLQESRLAAGPGLVLAEDQEPVPLDEDPSLSAAPHRVVASSRR
jgi:hypothetical protein